MKKSLLLFLVFLSLSLFVACERTVLEPEKPLHSLKKEQTDSRIPMTASSIVPVLNKTVGSDLSEYRLESQTAKYTNSNKTELKIKLADNLSITCENEFPLPDEKHIITILIKSKLNTPIDIGEINDNPDYEYKATIEDKNGAKELTAIEKLTVTTVNDSIVRGQIAVGNEEMYFEGEFFAAICG